MGKRRQKRIIRRQDNSIGCMAGLIRMFYSRHDANKLLLDRKQGSSRRHTFSGFPGNFLSPGRQLLKSSHLNGCFTVVNLPDNIWNSDIVDQSNKRQGLLYYDISSLVKLCQ